ncbi:MAG: hypothetical protein K2X01_06180 [Cyanobacteria bacterium]|nr:hypothetical protein [Cyanobacteriota bacterium]
MSGSGDRPGLGDKILNELRAAFSLLSKQLRIFAWPTSIDTDLTVFSADFHPALHGVVIEAPHVSVVDAWRQHSRFSLTVLEEPLVKQAVLSPEASCEWQAVACYEPLVDETLPEITGISFDRIANPRQFAWPIEPLIDPLKGKMEEIQEIQSEDWQNWTIIPETLTQSRMVITTLMEATAQARRLDQFLARVSPVKPPLVAMPLTKHPIPPHRFGAKMKDRFRQALAEQAGVRPSHVILKLVYDRVNPMLFRSIKIAERDALLCAPKQELIGRFRDERQFGRIKMGYHYLVVGIRLDTKATIQAMVILDDEEYKSI